MGSGFNLNTNVANLLRLGVVGASALGQIGTIVSGIGSTFAPSSILTKLGITGSAANNQITRGSGLNRRTSSLNQTSSSNLVGNAAGQDYTDSVVAQANADATAQVKEEQEKDQTKSLNDIHEYLLQVFDPKMTSITQMLAAVSGSTLTKASPWNVYSTTSGTNYTATTVSISSLGEANMSAENLSYMKNIDLSTRNILDILTSLKNGEFNVGVSIKEAPSIVTVSIPGF